MNRLLDHTMTDAAELRRWRVLAAVLLAVCCLLAGLLLGRFGSQPARDVTYTLKLDLPLKERAILPRVEENSRLVTAMAEASP